ncbi:sugar phosphate isomerase/epimerase family protein [Tabrizicola sp.]|uniref:sugar phosphate isomerase/epimerase family protein n=1 Tax=Tabrizicola sp. TaxID=2005166 RepID=UPI003F66F271
MRTKPLAERFEAAKTGGFTHMSMFPIDYKTMLDQGMTDPQITKAVRDSGIAIHVCDPFVQWVPNFEIPAGYPSENVAFIAHDEDFIYRMADTLGATTVNCVEGLGLPYETAALSDALGAFAARARTRGLQAVFEFMPISSVPDLAAGWALVEPLASEDVLLTFDTWHYFRSTPNPELLAQIPADRIGEVQLADADAEIRGANLIEDLLRYRKLPGEGSFDISGVVEILKTIGAYNSVGPEVFADAMDALDAKTAGERAGQSLDSFV